jgi:hypothetical protein
MCLGRKAVRQVEAICDASGVANKQPGEKYGLERPNQFFPLVTLVKPPPLTSYSALLLLPFISGEESPKRTIPFFDDVAAHRRGAE